MARFGSSAPTSGQAATTLLAWCASTLAAGAYFGFDRLPAHLLFWALAISLGLAAFTIVRAFYPTGGFADTTLRTGVLMLALVVSLGLVLGVTRLITPGAFVLAQGLVLVCALTLAPPGPGSTEAVSRSRRLVPMGLWVAIAAFVMGTGLGHSPFIAYDSLSYHLFFPARWLQAHHLSIIPTPFSDEAQAYQPANGELWFLWLMLPFHGDFLARVGQFPFYLVGAAALYALARRLGAAPPHAVYAPTFFLIAPKVVEQAVGANVDLIHAVLFVTAIYLGLVAIETDKPRDWALWGVCTGLFLGTKYLAVVYLPIVLVLPLIRGLRMRALWGLPGIVLFGLPWYVRNWVVAGSPIYPATLQVAGLTIGQGAYTRAAMARSFQHATDPFLLLMSAVGAFGATLFLLLLPAGLIIVLAIIRRRAWWPRGFLLLASIAMAPLMWLSVGDNTDSRFLLPAVVTSLCLLPMPFGANQRANALIHALYLLGIVWILVGADAQIPVSVPWYLGDPQSLHGVIARGYLVGFAALAGAATLLWVLTPERWAAPVATGVALAAGVTLAIGGEHWCVPSRCDYLEMASPPLRLNFLYGSRWLTDSVRDSNVAYTGINLPFALVGHDLTNVVSYVNIDRHADWRFHEYARAFRRDPSRAADPAALASGSGVYMPLAAGAGGFDATRPRFERMSGSREAWIANLNRRRVKYVFISTLDSYEIDYVWHNSERFPIEDEWARADPTMFHLVYANPDVRIYEVGPA